MGSFKGFTGLLACLLAFNVAQAQVGPPPGEEDSATAKTYPPAGSESGPSKTQTAAEKLAEEAYKGGYGNKASDFAGYKSSDPAPSSATKSEMAEALKKVEKPASSLAKKKPVKTGDNMTTGNTPTVVCDGNGGFRVEMNGHDNSQSASCMAKHEMQHIADWTLECPDACKGKPDGALPPGPDSKNSPESIKAMVKACPTLRDAIAYTSFITATECKGYNIEFWCTRELVKKANKEGKPIAWLLDRGDYAMEKYQDNWEYNEKYRGNPDWAAETKKHKYFERDNCRMKDAAGKDLSDDEADKIVTDYWEKRKKAKGSGPK